MTGSSWVILWRNLFLILQGVALLSFLALYAYRSQPAPRATSKLEANHVLTAADLVSDESKPLLGKALRVRVDPGDRVTEDLVKDPPPAAAPARPGTVAALVTVVESVAKQRNLVIGAKVAVQRRAQPDLPGTVISRDCDKQICTLAVMLEGLPQTEELNLLAFATADLVPRPQPPAAAASGP